MKKYQVYIIPRVGYGFPFELTMNAEDEEELNDKMCDRVQTDESYLIKTIDGEKVERDFIDLELE